MLNMNRRDSSVVCLFRFVAQLKKEVVCKFKTTPGSGLRWQLFEVNLSIF